MVVRVKMRITSKTSSRSIKLIVLANGGAESSAPLIVVDPKAAKELGMWPPPAKTDIYMVEEASTITHIYLIPNAVTIELLDEQENPLSKIEADLAIQEDLTEPLITDITIDELGIQVISFSKGLWRHKDDPPDKVRKSPKTI